MMRESTEEIEKLCIRSLTRIVLAMLGSGARSFRLVRQSDEYTLSAPVDIPEELVQDLYPDLMLSLKYIFNMNASLESPQNGRVDLDVPGRGKACLFGLLTYVDGAEQFTIEVERKY